MTLSERGSSVVRVVAALITLSIISVILRVFARLKRRVHFGVDDYLCFISGLLMIGMLIECVLCELKSIHASSTPADRTQGVPSVVMDITNPH